MTRTVSCCEVCGQPLDLLASPICHTCQDAGERFAQAWAASLHQAAYTADETFHVLGVGHAPAWRQAG